MQNERIKKTVTAKNNFSLLFILWNRNIFKNKIYTIIKKVLLEPSAETMNMDIFEGNKQAISTILDSTETLPFLSDKRFVIVKESGLFQAGRKNDSEKMADYLQKYQILLVFFFRNRS